MTHPNWDLANLQEQLIQQQEEYWRRGLEHKLYAESNDDFHAKWLYHRLLILSLIPEACRRPGTQVLDVGGGKGRVATLLSRLGLECINLDCIYLDQDAPNTEGQPLIPRLRAYCEEHGVKVWPHDFYSQGIPFPENAFDLAIFSEVIEHLPNSPKPVLSEIHRTLKKDGLLILTTPNVVSFDARRKTWQGKSTRDGIRGYYSMEGYPLGTVYRGHTREFTRQEVQYMLGQEGFELVSSETCDYAAPESLGRNVLDAFKGLGSSWRSGRLGMRTFFWRMAGLTLRRTNADMGDFVVIVARK